MRYSTFVRLGFAAAALSLFLVQPAIILAEDEQGTPTTEDTASEQPARENPHFFPPNQIQSSAPNETAAPAPSSSPARVAGESAAGNADHNLGTGLFSTLPFQLSASIHGGYDDNILTSQVPGAESSYVSPNIEINYKLADPRTTIVLKLDAGMTYYFDRASFPTTAAGTPDQQDYDVNLALGLTVAHKASARLTIGGAITLSYQTEPDFSMNVGTNRRTGNYFYNSDRIYAQFQWLPRFATDTSYNLSIVRYDDSAFGAFLDRAEQTVGNQFRFLLWPMTTVVAEARLLFVTYDESDSSLDSTTLLVLGGFEHKFSPRFGVTMRGGAQFRSFDSGGEQTEPYFESGVNYAAGRRTTLSWSTRYSLEEPGVTGSQSVNTFRTGLQTRYGIAPRIISTIALFYVHDDYGQGPPGVPALTEDSIDVNLALRYEINRSLGIDVGYGHTEVISNQSFREYSRNRYFGGVNFAF